jgi:hypothetical protein
MIGECLLSCFEDACDVNIFSRKPVVGADWLELEMDSQKVTQDLNYDRYRWHHRLYYGTSRTYTLLDCNKSISVKEYRRVMKANKLQLNIVTKLMYGAFSCGSAQCLEPRN